MLVVAGISLKNLKPRVWDPADPCYLPELRAVMVSYADFHAQRAQRQAAMDAGLHRFLGVPGDVKVYLDNGSFALLRRGGELVTAEYDEFVARAQPDWYPVPRDVIPAPEMSETEQERCLAQTMAVNLAYRHDGYVPVIHAGLLLERYVSAVLRAEHLREKPGIALGGLVPNLLRMPKAMPYEAVLAGLFEVRRAFAHSQLHIFGLGGTATVHLAALLAIDSFDSSGWRNRAARGLVQLPGSGDRMVAELGKWRGRRPSDEEWEWLAACPCPPCRRSGLAGLTASRIEGFSHRAAHNLWVLLDEVRQVEAHLADGSYAGWFEAHLDNSIYLPLIRQALAPRLQAEN